MKSSDLRIGNLVLVKHSFFEDGIRKSIDKYWTVAMISKNRVDYAENYCKGCKPKDPNPIPLTEELLLKFNLKKSESLISNETQTVRGGDNGFHGSICYSNSTLTIFIYKGEFYYIIDQNSDDYGTNYTSKEIKFVHELQNLHSALESEELIIK